MFSIFKSKASNAKKNNNDAPKTQSSMEVFPDIQSLEVIQIPILDNYYLIFSFKFYFKF